MDPPFPARHLDKDDQLPRYYGYCILASSPLRLQSLIKSRIPVHSTKPRAYFREPLEYNAFIRSLSIRLDSSLLRMFGRSRKPSIAIAETLTQHPAVTVAEVCVLHAPQTSNFNFTERNGLGRIDPSDRQHSPAVKAAFEFWTGCNFTTFNLIIGSIGPLVFSLRPQECIWLAILAIIGGCIPAGTHLFTRTHKRTSHYGN